MPSLAYCHDTHFDESNRSRIVILIAIVVVESLSNRSRIEIESQSNNNCNSRLTEVVVFWSAFTCTGDFFTRLDHQLNCRAIFATACCLAPDGHLAPCWTLPPIISRLEFAFPCSRSLSIHSSVDLGGRGKGSDPPIKNIGARVSFCPFNVLASQRSPRTPSWWGGDWLPSSPKNPTPTLGPSGQPKLRSPPCEG